jgi:oligosaccharide repeat unit polymerase
VQLRVRTLTPIFSALLVCIASFAIFQTTLRGNDATSAIASSALFIASILFARYILQIPLASGAMVYLILLGLFHLGLVVPWALGIYDISRAPSFTPHGLSRSIALINYSVIAFDLGLVLALFVGKQPANVLRQPSIDPENHEVYIAGCLLLAAGIVMFVVGLIGLDPLGYFRLTYSETFRLRAESDPRLFGSGITISFIGLSIAAAGASQKRFRLVAIMGAVWLISLMYWGFRGPGLIAAIVVYIIARKKRLHVPKWALLLALATALLILPVLRSGRESPLNKRFSQLSFKDLNIWDGPAEMGMSIRPLLETIDLIGPGDFRWGKTYWIGMQGIVPNLALRWESSASPREDDLPPNHWITAMVDPWSYKNYGGIGFSAIAEPYMNFGVAGVLTYFVFLAYFLIWLEQLSVRNRYALAAWALILGPLLWTTRNDFSNFFRSAVWGLLTLAAVKAISVAYANVLDRSASHPAKLTSRLQRVKHVEPIQ